MASVTLYLAILLITVLMGAYYKFLFRRRRKNEPPLVTGHPIWGSGEDFSKHAVSFLHTCQKKVGDIFTIRLLNQHLTIIMDPHSCDHVTKERNFDFDTIQKQVNRNVFSFQLVDARKMLKEAGKTVKGPSLIKGMKAFSEHLNESMGNVGSMDINGNALVPSSSGWQTDELRSFTSKTLFSAMFYTIFGKDSGSDPSMFEPQIVYRNFDQFHKYFNYLWLGVPVGLFPKACESLSVLVQQPSSTEFLSRNDLSDYIRFSMEFMKDHGQSESDIKGHNLVYLHVNYNTFRVAFWCLYKMMEHPKALMALKKEVSDAVNSKVNNRFSGEAKDDVTFDQHELEQLPILDSIVQETLRVSSGVFMVRYVTEDTKFTMDDGQSYSIRAGDRVAIYPPAIHKDPEIYEDPETFKYDRFVDAKFYKNGKQLKNPIMAFGSLCPGKRYALLQAKWYLFMLAHMFEFELVEGESTDIDVNYYGHEILPPTNDVHLRYRMRDSYRLENHPRLSFV